MCWLQTEAKSAKVSPSFAASTNVDWGASETKMDTRDSEMEAEDSVSQAEMTLVGGLPPGGNDDWPDWAASTSSMPMPVRYTTVEFPLLFEKLGLERLYKVGADSGKDQDFEKFVEEVKSESKRFRKGFTNALQTYSVLKGNEVPESCQYDTIGDIKKWGNGGKVCRPKCVGFIWPSTKEIREPVKFVPGKFTGLLKAKKLAVKLMAESTDTGKKVRVSRHCVGMIVTGMTESSELVEEAYFVNPEREE